MGITPRTGQQEGQHDLRHGGMVLPGKGLQGRVTHQAPAQLPGLRQRAVGHDRDLMLLHQGQQIVLDAPAAHIIKDLLGGTVRAVRLSEQLLHIGRVQIGNAPFPDAAFRFQLFHAFDGLPQGDAAAPVQQI